VEKSVESATKGHTVTLSTLTLLGWGGERKEKGKNLWVGINAISVAFGCYVNKIMELDVLVSKSRISS